MELLRFFTLFLLIGAFTKSHSQYKSNDLLYSKDI
jgi:hypothetical protein